jgi:hypothetical protein
MSMLHAGLRHMPSQVGAEDADEIAESGNSEHDEVVQVARIRTTGPRINCVKEGYLGFPRAKGSMQTSCVP